MKILHLHDIGLSKYSNFNWSTVDYDLMPQSFEHYKDNDILENDISAFDFAKNGELEWQQIFLKKLMISGGEEADKKMVYKIINEIKKDNKNIVEKMDKYFNNLDYY